MSRQFTISLNPKILIRIAIGMAALILGIVVLFSLITPLLDNPAVKVTKNYYLALEKKDPSTALTYVQKDMQSVAQRALRSNLELNTWNTNTLTFSLSEADSNRAIVKIEGSRDTVIGVRSYVEYVTLVNNNGTWVINCSTFNRDWFSWQCGTAA